ncbi:Amiloride-sensitive sodium channel subunit alpha [Holothuria leucospilota]|uniref:Amiloride-sensitive sodium channel subunit alpha n=1 Tax=Holothuria leucospilota TaxID=206669 RepID=A0A9Q1H0W3_HOLLE|nr:Amiloride-sensitive sodium channel subunit alpha [Holothuria leucospilota]
MKKQAFGEQKTTPGKVIEGFGDTTSAHGVPKIIGAPSAISAFLWTLVTLVALGLFCFQGGRLVLSFFSWPVTTKLDVVTRPTLRFPAVTICNMNKIRRSQIVDTVYEGLIELDGGPRDSTYDWWFSWSSEFYDNWRYNYGSSYDFSTYNNYGDSPSPSFSSDGSSPPPTSSKVPPDLSTSYAGGFPTSPTTSLPKSSFPTEESSSYVSPSFRRKKRSIGREKRNSKRRVPRQADWSSDVYDRFSFFRESWEDDFQYYNYYDFSTVTGENDWDGFYDKLIESGDFSKWLDIVSPSRADVERMGHQPEDFILQCSFDKKNCNYSDFLMFQNHLYGNCFTFNHAANMTVPRETGKTGAQNGLHLTLFVEQPEYIGLLTQETGVRVSINDPYSIAFPEDDGFTVPTGVSSSIGIRQVRSLLKFQFLTDYYYKIL